MGGRSPIPCEIGTTQVRGWLLSKISLPFSLFNLLSKTNWPPLKLLLKWEVSTRWGLCNFFCWKFSTAHKLCLFRSPSPQLSAYPEHEPKIESLAVTVLSSWSLEVSERCPPPQRLVLFWSLSHYSFILSAMPYITRLSIPCWFSSCFSYMFPCIK